MDIKKIIIDNLPDGVTLTDKQLAVIVKDIDKAVGDEFLPKTEHRKTLDAKIEADTKVSDLSGKLAEAEGYKAKYEAESKAHADTKATHEVEKTSAALDKDVSALLEKAGMHSAAIPKALKDYDRTKVVREADGKIKDADKLVETFKAEWGAFFGEVKKTGADVGTPPTGQQTDIQPKSLTDALRQHYEKKG